MKAIIFTFVLILFNFHLCGPSAKKTDLPNENASVQSILIEEKCLEFSRFGIDFSSETYLLDEKKDTVWLAIGNEFYFNEKKYMNIKVCGESLKGPFDSHYFSFTSNCYSELLINENDTIEYNVLDLSETNELRKSIDLKELSGFLAFSKEIICVDRRVVGIFRVSTQGIVFPFNNNSVVPSFINSFYWYEGEGIIGISIVDEEGASSKVYYH